MSNNDKGSAFIRPALDILAELRRGKLATELSETLNDAITAARDTGKKSVVTLKLTVDPEKTEDYETARIKISDSITASKPRRNVAPSVFYLTDDNNPVRTDPLQETFSTMRAVESPADDQKAVDFTQPSHTREAN